MEGHSGDRRQRRWHCHQIADGENGFLVKTVEEAAARIIDLLPNPRMRERMGTNGRESVRRSFLLSRYLEDWLDLIASFRAAAPWGNPS